MPTPRLDRILTCVLLFALTVSCGVIPVPARDGQPAPRSSSPVPVTEAPSTPALQATQPPAATHKPKGTRGPKGTPGQGKPNPPGQSGPQAFPTSSYVTSAADFNLILGRPTTNSITASLYSKTDRQITLAYGTQPGNYTAQIGPITLKANTPKNLEITNLAPDTSYVYTFNGVEHTFQTARAPGSTFTFTLDADQHNRDPNFNGELYAITLSNALADHPDFHINLGDTFMTEKVQARTYAEAESTFTDMRPYFGLLNADAPLFLVNGNHEGELGWLLKGTDNLAVWSTQLRQLYYPNPTPNGFYTGGSTPDAALGRARDGYYAWTWGDAIFIVLDPFWYTTPKPSPSDPNNNWNWTLGREQYDWLKTTLEGSQAKFKFVFIHNLVGGRDTDGRGGIEAVPYFEWGGKNADGSEGFAANRPGWGVPIHQLLIQNQVSAVFHGHDHVFVKQDLDGIVYQECPQPSMARYDQTQMAQEYGYLNGVILGSSGHLRLTVSPNAVTVDYVRAYLPQDENASQKNGQVSYSYTLSPR